MLNQSIINKIDELDEKTILLILGYLTEELQREVITNQNIIHNKEEAYVAILTLLETMGESYNQLDSTVNVKGDAHYVALARQILKVFIDDEKTRPKIEKLVFNPPIDSQMSFESAIASVIVLGTVITWLQTKITIKVTRKDGKTEFKFELQKATADMSVIRSVAQLVESFLKGS